MVGTKPKSMVVIISSKYNNTINTKFVRTKKNLDASNETARKIKIHIDAVLSMRSCMYTCTVHTVHTPYALPINR